LIADVDEDISIDDVVDDDVATTLAADVVQDVASDSVAVDDMTTMWQMMWH
jgi:hypothetical protein